MKLCWLQSCVAARKRPLNSTSKGSHDLILVREKHLLTVFTKLTNRIMVNKKTVAILFAVSLVLPGIANAEELDVSESPSRIPSDIPSDVPSLQPTLTLQPSDSPSLSGMPSTIPSHQPSSQPSIAPSSIPSLQPSITPTSDPTLSLKPTTSLSHNPSASIAPSNSVAPSSAPTQCRDSKLRLILPWNKKEKNCQWVGKIPKRTKGRCNRSNVRAHCPVTCDACDRYACKDSPFQWIMVNIAGKERRRTCEWVKRKPSKIDKRCKIKGIKRTCRETCNFCA